MTAAVIGLTMASTGLATVPISEAAVARGGANAAPTTEVLSPRGPITRTRVVIRGRATDDRAITKVKVTVKDRGTGRYWNPARRRWQRQWLWYNAALQQPRAATTEWLSRFNAERAGGSGRYRVTAVAWDDQGRRDPGVARSSFRIDSTPTMPTTSVVTPTEGAALGAGPVSITGSATGQPGVRRVMVTVRDMDRTRYWNPNLETWQSSWLWNEAQVADEGAARTDWSYDFDPLTAGGPGRYRVTATAWDTDGRQDRDQHTVRFSTAAEPAGDDDAPADGRTLVWNDEFNGDTLDPTRWKTFSGLYNTPYCFQNYTARPRNVRVENGRLVLEAHREASNGQAYTSGMVVSNDFREAANSSHRGNTAWTHGRFEMRARVPDTSGLWPAFWMRPEESVYGSWPRSGEIDILEYAGPTPTSWNDRRIVNDLHWWSDSAPGNNGSHGRATPVTAGWLEQFHTYAVEWDTDGFRWYVDGELTHQARSGWSAPGTPAPAPFDQDFFITLNLQVGGWAGPVANSALPGAFEIDWVRVYQ